MKIKKILTNIFKSIIGWFIIMSLFIIFLPLILLNKLDNFKNGYKPTKKQTKTLKEFWKI